MDLLFGVQIPDLSAKKTRAAQKPAQKPAKDPAARVKATRTLAANDTQKPERDRPARGAAPRLPIESFTPRRRVTFIGTQICPCCEQKVTYIAGDLLEYVPGESEKE